MSNKNTKRSIPPPSSTALQKENKKSQPIDNKTNTPTPTSKSGLGYVFRQGVFLFISTVLVWGISRMPKNKEWMNGSIKQFYEQKNMYDTTSSVGFRQDAAGGINYRYSEFIRKNCKPSDYFLIPPQRYLLANAYSVNNPSDIFSFVYPSTMYYYAKGNYGLVEMSQPANKLNKATHTLWAQGGQLSLIVINDTNRKLVLDEFRKYDPKFCAYSVAQAQNFIKK